MADEIINKVSQSSLVTIYLEDYYPKGDRVLVDIKDQLYKGIALKEKDFRVYIKETDWSTYQDKYVGLICSVDAIIPVWAFMLLAQAIEPFAKKVILGDLDQLETSLYQDLIEGIDASEYQDAKIVIKGCGQLPVPNSAYIALTEKLRPVASSIMYGEACSTVPLYKKKK